MKSSRRDFLRGTAWMGAAAAMYGCMSAAKPYGRGRMSGFAVAPLDRVRTGVIGLGMRGQGAVHRLSMIPGVEVVALCDLYADRVARQQKWLEAHGRPKAAHEFSGEEGWKAMCELDLDLVYVVTPWALHAQMGVYAMAHGKHVAIEVPSAMTLDECWALVETAERTGRHCMQLENCCYGEVEMLALNLVRNGKLGELVHGEGAYIHDLRDWNFRDPADGGYQGYWRLRWNRDHFGNPYPTHGLLPIMQAMNVNRGDRMDYLTCVSSAQVGMDAYAKARFGEDSWQAKLNPRCGDMSTTVIRTVKGRTIMVQHDVTSPRPYSRINLLSGTLGCLCDYPPRITLANKPGDGAHHWFNFTKQEAEGILGRKLDEYWSRSRVEDDRLAAEYAARVSEEWKHPLWKIAGELATKVGGHGGMDFLMDLRLAYCLENGLPLDMDVYDLATSCSLCELTERSATHRGESVDVPDFTRGGWETASPLGIESLSDEFVARIIASKDSSALNV